MRIFLISLILGLAYPYKSISQSLSGQYFIATSNGEIILSLESKNNGEVGGFMQADDGSKYTIRAQEEMGEVYGYLVSTTGSSLYFEAYPDENGLYLAIAPILPNQEIDYDNMQEFKLNKRNKVSASDQASVKLRTEDSPDPIQKMIAKEKTQKGQNPFVGEYHGDINGTSSVLSISVDGNQLSGILDASGYKYHLRGQVSGAQANGIMTDSQTQGQLQFTSEASQGVINFHFTFNDPNTGQAGSFDLRFTKNGVKSNNPGMAAGRVQLDRNLIGIWTYSESHTSGEFSFAAQWQMQINQDGTYLYGKGKVAGGGPGVGGSSGGGEVSRGQCKTENGKIYINEGQGWFVYAGYYIEGNKLLLKFNDGSRQIWYR